MKYLEVLEKSPVFKGLDGDEISRVLEDVRWQVKSYAKGSTLMFRGDDVANLILLVEGRVFGVMIDPDGKYVKIEDIEAPKPVATGFMYGQKRFFPVDVVADSDVKVMLIPREDFNHLMSGNPVIQENFLNIISNRAQFLTTKIRLLSRKTLKGKLAQIIVEQDPHKSGTVNMPMSQQKAADLIGVARPSLARTFSELLEEGVVDGSWREFKILKYRILESYLFD